MKAKICDRCGVLYRVPDVREHEEKTYTVTRYLYLAGRPRPKQRVMDLCEGCREKLAQWMENGEDRQNGQG